MVFTGKDGIFMGYVSFREGKISNHLNHLFYQELWAKQTKFLDVRLFDAWKKWPKNILPHGGEKLWFTMVTMVRSEKKQKLSRYI